MVMERLIVLIVFCAVAALIVPSYLENNPQLLEQASAKPDLASQEPTAIERVSLSGEETIEMNAQGHFVTDFRMNGRSVEALVDTGATIVAINKTTARQLGISVIPADFRHQVSTANGNIKVAMVNINSVEIGSIRVRNVQAAVIDDRALPGTLLGMSFLRQLKSFQVADGELILKQ
jgi:aspartyl protease family protein